MNTSDKFFFGSMFVFVLAAMINFYFGYVDSELISLLYVLALGSYLVFLKLKTS